MELVVEQVLALIIVFNVLDLVKIFSFEVLVVSIFYLAYSPANQRTHLGYLGPFGAYLGKLFQDEFVLFTGPVFSDDVGIENVVPSLSTLTT